ncbi:MAG: hypothetical protein IID49_02510 [Proteobacteria bacterium]|nr:hypothetical protein [Pseudomonadota bacterium]
MKVLLILCLFSLSVFAIDGSIIESNLDIAGGFSANIESKTADYTMLVTDHVVLASTTIAGLTITLPAVSGVTGLIYHVKKIDASAGIITIDGNASETIDDVETATLTTQYESIMIISDGAEWWKI